MKRKSIILLGHGSRRSEANDILRSVISIVKPKLDGIYAECAFLEFAEPTLGGLIEEMAKGEFDSIFVIPYFLYSGNHVSRDIPEILEKFRTKYPKISIKLGEPLGIDERLAELVMEKFEAMQ